jgi:Fe-S cluster biogenesis protein NfuA
VSPHTVERNPRAAQRDGDISFEGFRDGVVYLAMKRVCSGRPSSSPTLRRGDENFLEGFLPEEVKSARRIRAGFARKALQIGRRSRSGESAAILLAAVEMAAPSDTTTETMRCIRAAGQAGREIITHYLSIYLCSCSNV